MLGGMSSIRSPIKSTAKQCQLDFTENTARKRNPVTQFGRNAEFLAIEDGRCRMLYVSILSCVIFPSSVDVETPAGENADLGV